MTSQGVRDEKRFRFPSSSYDRLFEASAAGRQVRPPFVVGGTVSRCDDSGSGHDFPSMIASELIDGGAANGKVAAGDGPSSRRVRFSDQDLPCSNVAEMGSRARIPRSPTALLVKKSRRSMIKRSKPGDYKSIDSSAPSSSLLKFKGIANQLASDEKRNSSVGGTSSSEIGKSSMISSVKMNNAATKRHDFIRQRLRTEWLQYSGVKKMCPFV